MTPRQFLAARDRLGLTTDQLAGLLGMEPRTVRRYLDGTREIPQPVQRILWLMLRQADGWRGSILTTLRDWQEPDWPDSA